MAEEILLKINNENTKSAASLLAEYKERISYPDRQSDVGLVNPKNSSMVVIKENGDINLTQNETSNIKINNNQVVETAPESVTVTNRKTLHTDEIVVNNHKLNPQILELSDVRVLFDNPDDAIGNLMMDGTVLVKTWEPNLNRYVLMRRKIRTPLFSKTLNTPQAPENMDVVTQFIDRLDINAAKLLKQEKDRKDKITAEMLNAQGGSNYDQGDYNNYDSEFSEQSSNSITSQGGMSIDNANTESTTLSLPSNVRQMLVDESKKDKRPGIPLSAEYITIHSTGNASSSAANERRWLDNPANTRKASWHICVDENEAILAIPTNEVAYHAGNGNSKSIGIEICENGNRERTLDAAALLVANILKAQSWGVDKLKRHYDWTQKNCPRILNEDGKWSGWDDFIKRVERNL